MNQLAQRQTQYCQLVEQALSVMGHATNAQLLDKTRQTFPSISATTIHRITTRLAERQKIATAPSASDGSTRYDFNTKPHDHFKCTECDSLRDIDIKDSLMPLLQSNIKDCKMSGRLLVSGICKNCINIS